VPGSPRIDLGEGFVRSAELLEELRSDITKAYAALETQRDSQYFRRCVVRAIYSFIEATVESIKVELRSTIRCGHYTAPLSDKESEALGSLHVVGPRSDKFLPLDQNVKATFRLASKIWALKGYSLNTQGEDFQDFLRSKSARNRLTHPKTYYDIEVTDFDMHCHTIAGMWMQAELRSLHEARIRSLAEALPAEEREAFVQSFLTRNGRTDESDSVEPAADA
jgi:hypothetical protein